MLYLLLVFHKALQEGGKLRTAGDGPAGGLEGDRRNPHQAPKLRLCLLGHPARAGHVKRMQWVSSHQHLNMTYLLTAEKTASFKSGRGKRQGGLAGYT